MAVQRFGERLAQLRRQKGVEEHRDILHRDVAKAIGSSATSVSRWEDNQIFPNAKALDRLAAYFGVTRGWLRYGEGERDAGTVTTGAKRGTKVADLAEPAPKGRRHG